MRYALNNPRNSLVFIDCFIAQSTELVSLYIGYWTLNNYYYYYYYYYDMDVKMCTLCTNKDIYI